MTTTIQHDIKTLPEYFDAVIRGDKTFEVRKGDRPYAVGDVLALREWTGHDGYSGRILRVRMTYILPGGEFGIDPDYVVMGIRAA